MLAAVRSSACDFFCPCSQVDGSALGQHMEDFYLSTLKEAVLAADPALAGKVQRAMQAAADKVAPAAAAAQQ
jgi:hypothetical protein